MTPAVEHGRRAARTVMSTGTSGAVAASSRIRARPSPCERSAPWRRPCCEALPAEPGRGGTGPGRARRVRRQRSACPSSRRHAVHERLPEAVDVQRLVVARARRPGTTRCRRGLGRSRRRQGQLVRRCSGRSTRPSRRLRSPVPGWMGPPIAAVPSAWRSRVSCTQSGSGTACPLSSPTSSPRASRTPSAHSSGTRPEAVVRRTHGGVPLGNGSASPTTRTSTSARSAGRARRRARRHRRRPSRAATTIESAGPPASAPAPLIARSRWRRVPFPSSSCSSSASAPKSRSGRRSPSQRPIPLAARATLVSGSESQKLRSASPSRMRAAHDADERDELLTGDERHQAPTRWRDADVEVATVAARGAGRCRRRRG